MNPHPGLICAVCAGFHHSDDCERARRFIAEVRTSRVSDPPGRRGHSYLIPIVNQGDEPDVYR